MSAHKNIKTINPVMAKHNKFGACDTDACDVIRGLYTNMMKKLFRSITHWYHAFNG